MFDSTYYRQTMQHIFVGIPEPLAEAALVGRVGKQCAEPTVKTYCLTFGASVSGLASHFNAKGCPCRRTVVGLLGPPSEPSNGLYVKIRFPAISKRNWLKHLLFACFANDIFQLGQMGRHSTPTNVGRCQL